MIPVFVRRHPESVAALTAADVRDYFDRAYRPDLTTLIVVGNISPERARALVEREFGEWVNNGPQPSVNLPIVPDNKSATLAVLDTALESRTS